MKRILVATDLSGRSDRALQRAVALAREFGAELAVVHVIDESLPARVLARHEEAAKSAIEEQVCSLPAADGRPGPLIETSNRAFSSSRCGIPSRRAAVFPAAEWSASRSYSAPARKSPSRLVSHAASSG